jgi:hypothetical protein
LQKPRKSRLFLLAQLARVPVCGAYGAVYGAFSSETIRDNGQNVDAELRKTEEAVERYLLAFEAGTLPEAQCGERVRSLGAKAADLRARREELRALLDESQLSAPTEQELADARAEIRKGHDQWRRTGPQSRSSEPRPRGAGGEPAGHQACVPATGRNDR